jgi:DNA-directed RNA polymerase specialized sigma24 family protein
VLAARMTDIAAALGRLDDERRALLDLSLRRGMDDEEIAGILRVDAAEVSRRRGELLERLAEELGLDGREQQEELRATLPDLPPELWRGG